MNVTRTYLDSSVLIAAAHGAEGAYEAAMRVLDDPNRTFIASDFVRIETAPVARFHGRADEADFYDTYLDGVSAFVSTTPQLIVRGIAYVTQFGVIGIDALHLAAAELGGADEFITAEKPGRPFFRVTTLRIIGIHP